MKTILLSKKDYNTLAVSVDGEEKILNIAGYSLEQSNNGCALQVSTPGFVYSIDLDIADSVSISGSAFSGTKAQLETAINTLMLSTPSSGASTVTVYQLKTTLTDAQVKALPTTPVEVIPAPGPGKAIYAPCALQLGQAVLKINWHGNYSNIDVNGRIVFDLAFIAYTGYRNTNSMTDFFAWGENGPAWLLGGNDVIASGVNYNGISDWENQPLMLRIQNNDSGLGNLTGGDPANTLEVTVFYSIVDL